ncbi:MAG: tetratricopeptide repeat protein [Bacteroidetes bacterium]|nr:tetratricopeptide repeat protein [Bacteroidota bacterium]
MRNFTFSLIMILAAFSIIGCSTPESDQQTTSTSSIEVPELLDRPSKIQYGQEWERTQNKYAEYKGQLQTDEAPEALLHLAQLFTIEARITGEHGHYYQGALELLDQLLQKEDLEEDVHFMALSTKAGVQLSQHDFSKALNTGKEAVKMNPHNARIYGVLVDASVELGDYEQAVKYADKMVSIRPDLRSYSRISYLREIHGMPEAAIEAMEMAVEAGAPGSEEIAWTRLQLGELHERYGNIGAAKKNFEIILAERPNYPFAIAALARLDKKSGNFEKAETRLNEACAIIPEFGFYQDLAVIYQLTGREKEARKQAEEVLLMLEDDVANGHNMNLEYADLYLNLLDMPDKALTYAKDEYEKRPDNITVNLYLAEIYQANGDQASAQKHLEKALVTNSEDPALISLAETISK